MITKKTLMTIIVSFALGSGLAILYMRHIQPSSPHTAQAPTEKKVLFWYDPMMPNTKFDQPGKSPFMDMDLVPKYADEGDSESSVGIRIDPTQVQNLGVKTAPAQQGRLQYSYQAPATLSFNDYQHAIIQSRGDGFVEKVYPYAIGDYVQEGAPLAEITIPDWNAAQSEYLILKARKTSTQGALERLRITGMPTELIDKLITTGKVQTTLTLRAPISGVITDFSIKTGMNILKSTNIATIQGLDPIWITAEIPESIAHILTNQTAIDIAIPSFPDQHFSATQWVILPNINPVTHAIQLRIELANDEKLLKPGMNARIKLTSQSDPVLLIPSQAIIDTGNEQHVITLNEQNRFVPKIVKIFRESNQSTAILSGLQEGERVVVTGQFLIDSEANIAGALDAMRATEESTTSTTNAVTSANTEGHAHD